MGGRAKKMKENKTYKFSVTKQISHVDVTYSTENAVNIVTTLYSVRWLLDYAITSLVI